MTDALPFLAYTKNVWAWLAVKPVIAAVVASPAKVITLLASITPSSFAVAIQLSGSSHTWLASIREAAVNVMLPEPSAVPTTLCWVVNEISVSADGLSLLTGKNKLLFVGSIIRATLPEPSATPVASISRSPYIIVDTPILLTLLKFLLAIIATSKM